MTRQQLEDWMNEHGVPPDAQVLVELDMGLLEPVNPDYRQINESDVDTNCDDEIGKFVGKFVLVL